ARHAVKDAGPAPSSTLIAISCWRRSRPNPTARSGNCSDASSRSEACAPASARSTFLDRYDLTFKKKSAYAAEQDRPDVLEEREDWFEGQLDLDPERLVFVDESFATTNMARRYGRAPRGVRLRAPIPHGNRKKTTPLGP